MQETLVRAWASKAAFRAGTNMMAWLYTILRNAFYSEYRRRRHEVADADGLLAATLTTAASQESHLHFQDFRTALLALADDQREAVLLVGSSGLSYEEAAQICNCAVGTMKSRVYRARTRLAQMLSGNPATQSRQDALWQIASNVSESAGE